MTLWKKQKTITYKVLLRVTLDIANRSTNSCEIEFVCFEQFSHLFHKSTGNYYYY